MCYKAIQVKLWMIVCLLYCVSAFSYEGIGLLHAPIDPGDLPSLQRGAKMYINYCSGCHSLNFMRYNQLARGIGIVNADGSIAEQVVKNNLIFTGARISDTLRVAMNKDDAKVWFGVAAPDLSVIAKARGTDWLYTYLLGFYRDKSRPLGVNNLVFNETAMPDVLVNLRGTQLPVYESEKIVVDGKPQTIKVIKHLILTEHGTMLPVEFDGAVTDLVNFLAYAADPIKSKREQLGWWIIGYLIIFAALAYLLKWAYWKNIK